MTQPHPLGCEQVSAPLVPERFRKPLFEAVEDLMPAEWTHAMGVWFRAHMGEFVRGGDPEGLSRFNWELCTIQDAAPDLIGQFRARLTDAFPKALAACHIPDFDLRFIEVNATLHHHGSHFIWHDDAPGYDGAIVPSRRLTFAYYLHSEPKMFRGGELEFADGSLINPKHNRLVMFHPLQQHRVRMVECWSAEAVHGRWALVGWVHGDPPEGWVDRIPRLRGIPSSG